MGSNVQNLYIINARRNVRPDATNPCRAYLLSQSGLVILIFVLGSYLTSQFMAFFKNTLKLAGKNHIETKKGNHLRLNHFDNATSWQTVATLTAQKISAKTILGVVSIFPQEKYKGSSQTCSWMQSLKHAMVKIRKKKKALYLVDESYMN